MKTHLAFASNISKNALPIFWCSFFIVTLLACQSNPQTETGPHANAILNINSKAYSLEAFHFYLSQSYPEIELDGDPGLLSHALDQFKREIVMAELANFSGYFISEDQVGDFIENKLTTMSFHLKSSQERASWQAIIRRRLAIQELLQNETLKNVHISDQAIQTYYQTHQTDYQGETLYQIRVVQTAEKEGANKMLKALKTSREPFTKTVAEFAENDGYKISQTFPISGLTPPFQKAINRLRPGRHSNPIPVKQGELTVYYVLYLEAIIPAKPISYEEAHNEIQVTLRQIKAKELLDKQLTQFLRRLPISQHNEYLPFAYIEPNQRSTNQ